MPDISHTQIMALCDAIEQRTGHRFHDYAQGSLKRRLERFLDLKNKEAENLIKQLLKDQALANEMVSKVTVNVTEMFRNASFFLALQEKVFPAFKSLDQVNIWHAGCSSGEETYSTAILLAQNNVLDKCSLLGTDLSEEMIVRAKSGNFALRQILSYQEPYALAGGIGSLQNHYEEKTSTLFQIKPEYQKRCSFSCENVLSTSHSNSFNLIMCRNMLIYFDLGLQDTVVGSLYESLKVGGYLCLGEKETLRFTSVASHFKAIDAANKIYQKID